MLRDGRHQAGRPRHGLRSLAAIGVDEGGCQRVWRLAIVRQALLDPV